jgi:transposase InsO family protein
MGHANARLTVLGRRLLVERVRFGGRPVAHVAAEMGCSRQCAYRWLARFDAEGWDGLHDRSSRPHRCPTRTPAAVEIEVLRVREQLRAGRDRVAAVSGVAPRTVSRILARHARPPIAVLDPTTGLVIRAWQQSTHRYERSRPGELIHVDVKKLGRIPDGGGWRSHGRAAQAAPRARRQRAGAIGFDYVHAAVDDHSRLAYAEVHPDETGETAAAFLLRAAEFFAAHGAPVQEVISDNAFAYRRSRAFREAAASIGARQLFIKPHCPWQNGKVERFNRTLAAEWAYRRAFTSNTERAEALAPWLEYYNTERDHLGIGGCPPISRCPSPT